MESGNCKSVWVSRESWFLKSEGIDPVFDRDILDLTRLLII